MLSESSLNTDYYQINKSYKFIHLFHTWFKATILSKIAGFNQKFYIMISACMGLIGMYAKHKYFCSTVQLLNMRRERGGGGRGGGGFVVTNLAG